MTKGCEKFSVKKKKRKKKLAKSKTRKGSLSQKWASRWIENPKGRSRQKLGIFKKIIQKMMKKEQNKNKDRGLTVQMEECTLCWFTGGDFCQSVWLMGFIPINGNFSLWFEMASLACGLIDGDFCLWYWWMATSACALIDGDFCQMVDWLVSSR